MNSLINQACAISYMYALSHLALYIEFIDTGLYLLVHIKLQSLCASNQKVCDAHHILVLRIIQ